MAARGAVYNRERAVQARDFTGLRYGAITPTDIDGCMDFGGRAFVFIETKRTGCDLPYGQRLALERIAQAIHAGGKPVLIVVGTHDTPVSQDIDFARCKVAEAWYGGTWRRTEYGHLSVRDLIDGFLTRNQLHGYLEMTA